MTLLAFVHVSRFLWALYTVASESVQIPSLFVHCVVASILDTFAIFAYSVYFNKVLQFILNVRTKYRSKELSVDLRDKIVAIVVMQRSR